MRMEVIAAPAKMIFCVLPGPENAFAALIFRARSGPKASGRLMERKRNYFGCQALCAPCGAPACIGGAELRDEPNEKNLSR